MKWSKEEEQYLRDWYGKTATKNIAEHLGRPKTVVYARAAKLGLSGTAIWADQDIAFLKKNYITLGAKETAKRLGRTLTAVHTKIREVGGGYPSSGSRNDWADEEIEFLKNNYQLLSWDQLQDTLGRTRQSISHQAQVIGIKRYVDPYLFFETWTEESAYAIGFFAADGWILKRGPKSVRIGFSQKESDIIYKLKDTIGTGRISVKSDGMYEYYIQSIRVYKRLCDIFGHDVHRKSRTIRWPDIPDEYVRHFVRGAFDGDGSLFLRSDNLWECAYTTSSRELIYQLVENVFRLTGIVMSVGLNKVDVYHARCSGVKAVCLMSWMYDGCSIALDRKLGIAQKAMETIGIAYKSSVTDKMREVFPDILSGYDVR